MTKEMTTMRTTAIGTLAARLGVEPGEVFMRSLKGVAFRTPDVTNEQLMALVLVANQYQLNPFTKELYAFPDSRGGGIVPIVSVDGWFRIINEHPQFDGLEYEELTDEAGRLYGECTIYRKDRSHPTKIREWFHEVGRATDPWRSHKSRMLRHKTIIQCSRIAFGFAGIFDPEEGERILAATAPAAAQATSAARLEAILGPPLTEPNVVSMDQPIVDLEALTEDERAVMADAARTITPEVQE